MIPNLLQQGRKAAPPGDPQVEFEAALLRNDIGFLTASDRPGIEHDVREDCPGITHAEDLPQNLRRLMKDCSKSGITWIILARMKILYEFQE